MNWINWMMNKLNELNETWMNEPDGRGALHRSQRSASSAKNSCGKRMRWARSSRVEELNENWMRTEWNLNWTSWMNWMKLNEAELIQFMNVIETEWTEWKLNELDKPEWRMKWIKRNERTTWAEGGLVQKANLRFKPAAPLCKELLW
jgi:hypothetical protein